MSFNGGGANTSGVQAAEQGVIDFNTANTTFSVAGGETLNTDFTVPAGKKWIVKGIATSVGSFVGTLSSTFMYVYDNSVLFPVSQTTGNTSSITYSLPQPITLPAGYKIRIRSITSAWTSGQQIMYALVQEVDA